MEERNKAKRESQVAEIDLLELFGVWLHWAWLIIGVALLCGILAFCYSKFFIPEQFQSTTRVYVLNRSASTTTSDPTYQDLQVGTQLTKDYSVMTTSRHVLEKVIEDLHLPYDYDKLKSKVSVSTMSDTRIVQITVTDEDPAAAQRIANKVREEASQHIKQVMAIDAINVVDVANLPTKKSAPSNSKNAVIGALIGGILVAGFVTVRYLLDDTVKTGDDVEQYLNMSCLALIPLDAAVSKGDAEAEKRRKKKKVGRISIARDRIKGKHARG